MDTAPLSVVIPCFNEAGNIERILRRVAAVSVVREIIVVDDCSTDGTRSRLQRVSVEWPAEAPPLRLVLQEVNKGKGAALRTGFGYVTGPLIIVQDADLEYDPAEYPKLIQPIQDGDADVVYGSRFAGHPRRVLYFWHSLGNRVLTTFSNMLTNLNLSDMETCYKVFRADVLKATPLRSNRFGFEPEVTAKMAKLGCRIYEVPISYRGRSYAEGKKIGWRDGVQALWLIFKFWLVDDLGRPRRDGVWVRLFVLLACMMLANGIYRVSHETVHAAVNAQPGVVSPIQAFFRDCRALIPEDSLVLLAIDADPNIAASALYPRRVKHVTTDGLLDAADRHPDAWVVRCPTPFDSGTADCRKARELR